MGLEIGRQSNEEHILVSAGTSQNHRREREGSKPCQWDHFCTLQDGKAGLSLVRALQLWSGCLQVTVASAVISPASSMGRSQWTNTIVDASNKIISSPSPAPFLPPL